MVLSLQKWDKELIRIEKHFDTGRDGLSRQTYPENIHRVAQFLSKIILKTFSVNSAPGRQIQF